MSSLLFDFNLLDCLSIFFTAICLHQTLIFSINKNEEKYNLFDNYHTLRLVLDRSIALQFFQHSYFRSVFTQYLSQPTFIAHKVSCLPSFQPVFFYIFSLLWLFQRGLFHPGLFPLVFVSLQGIFLPKNSPLRSSLTPNCEVAQWVYACFISKRHKYRFNSCRRCYLAALSKLQNTPITYVDTAINRYRQTFFE